MDKKIVNWVIAIIIAIVYLAVSFMFCAWTYSWLIWVSYAIYRFIESNKKISNRVKKIIISVIMILTLLVFIIPFGVSIYIYNQTFGIRYESYAPLKYSLIDFPELKREKYEFNSNKGQKLVGYNYYRENQEVKGMIILAHGFGDGGHNFYMDCANYFTKNGYTVFAFDATGNDESEGKAVNGLPQGVIDLDYAISFVEKQEKFKNLPIMLFGHSWGGYAVTNVLNYHPEIKAVVSFSGFNKSSDLIESQGEEMVGNFIKIAIPYLNLYEKIKFGEYATNTSMSGFENSNAGVMIIHSEDDDIVQKKYGYDIYYKKYSNTSRFQFIAYTDKGHNQIYYSDSARKYMEKFNEDFDRAFEDRDLTPELKAEYINENLDRNEWANLLDEEIFNNIIKFYNYYV